MKLLGWIRCAIKGHANRKTQFRRIEFREKKNKPAEKYRHAEEFCLSCNRLLSEAYLRIEG